MNIIESIETIKKWAEKNQFKLEFKEKTKIEKIKKLEKIIGLKLPEEVKTYLSYANGESFTSNGIIGNWRLMEVKYIISEWEVMKQLLDDKSFGNNTNKETPYVKGFWWNPKWLPIVSSCSGHLICVDMDPNKQGNVGQIILFLHDKPDRYLIAESLGKWFKKIAEDMDRGLYKVTPEGIIDNEAFMWSSTEGKDLYNK